LLYKSKIRVKTIFFSLSFKFLAMSTQPKPQEQGYWRLVAERKGAQDARMLEFRWLLEELRVSFFAQELRTPQPVSIKRLEKAWGQLNH
jgi:ATP-dependent helicase HrpA